jgi:hypothetical protein
MALPDKRGKLQDTRREIYELGPEPAPDDIDGCSPAIVTWYDADLFFLVASNTSSDELVRIAVSLYAQRRIRRNSAQRLKRTTGELDASGAVAGRSGEDRQSACDSAIRLLTHHQWQRPKTSSAQTGRGASYQVDIFGLS